MTAAPPRVLGASAAAVVLVGVPLIITPAKPDKPAPVKGALTIELSGDHGASDPYRFVTTGPSPSPSPTARATLRDTSGEHTATASPQKSPCPSASRRVAFPELKGTDWCVQLERVSAGHELAGTVTSGANELALTVHRRDGFWLAPGLLLLAGLLAGIAVALVPRWLRTVVRRIVLVRMLRDNERTDPRRRIYDLDARWVDERLNAGDTRESVIAAINRVVTSGPDRAFRARARLKKDLAAIPDDLKDHPLVTNSAAVANRSCNKIDDFIVDGEERKQHPADEWAAALGLLIAYHADLADLQRLIGSVDPALRPPAEAAVGAARQGFSRIEGPTDLPDLERPLEEARLAIDRALAETTIRARRREAVGEGPPPAMPGRHRSALQSIIPLDLSAGTLRGWAMIARAATGALVIVALLYAFFTIKQSAYDAKPLFHAGSDYLTLFSAALASGAAATVIALVSNWKPVAGEDEAA